MYKFAICFLAGIGAGLGTGFAGMSAAAVISPMLITFLGLPAYEAVGIALASDVLASAVSAYTYGKNKNLDIRNGLVMMAAVLAFIVMYDAAHVRLETGKQAKVLNQLMRNLGEGRPETFEEDLKELIGHTPLQVAVGAALGIAMGVGGSLLPIW